MARSRGKAPSQRQLRVGEELRHALALILSRGDLHDPELRDVPITVTEVRSSPDLRSATVFVMPLGGGEEAMLVEALNRAAAYLQSQLAREVSLKFTPRLSFQADASFDEARRVDALLRDAAGPADAGATPEDEHGA
jgi:ribosome-binding factor A